MLDYPRTERVEAAGRNGDVVHEQRVDDDPHHRPERNTAPFDAAANAICAGKPHTAMAMIKPATRPARAACQAGRLSTPSNMRTVAMGTIATKKDNVRLSPTGVNN